VPVARGLPLIHLAVFAAVTLPYFTNLGVSSLWDSNEAFYAETAREMIETGCFLTPTFNFQPRVKKPPLTYLSIALCYELLGVGESSVRLPGALAASGLMIFVYLTGQLLFSPRAALVSLMFIGTTTRVMLLARKLPIDILLLFLLAGTAYFLIRGIARSSTPCWLLAYAFSALGFLTKGPIAVIIPFGTVAVWAAWSHGLSLREMRVIPGALVFSIIAFPWYVMVYLNSGWTYIATFLLRENFGRFFADVMGPSRGPFYYGSIYLAEFFPWSILSIAACACLWRIRGSFRSWRGLAWGFPLTWSLLTLTFFTISMNKQEYYIAPMYPMMALILAAVLDLHILTLTEEAAAWLWQRMWKPALIVITVFFLGGAVALPPLIGAAIPGTNAALRYGPSLVLLVCAAFQCWSIRNRRLSHCIAALIVSWWVLLLSVPVAYLPAAESSRPVRSLCADLKPLLSPDDEVGYYRAAAPSMVFYLRRPIFEELEPGEMVRRFQSPKRVFCLMSESERRHLSGAGDLALYVLDRRPQLISRLRELTDEKSRMERELVLVSNQPVKFGAAADRRQTP
jgi:4-amino-4-deoxy-L-arabinose transferase-like glycosyltransferase